MKVRNGIGKRERERESAREQARERERERARWRCREKEKRERSATAPHTRCCGRILSLVLLSASLSAWMRAQLAVCLRKVTCEVPSVRARTHMYIYIYILELFMALALFRQRVLRKEAARTIRASSTLLSHTCTMATAGKIQGRFISVETEVLLA